MKILPPEMRAAGVNALERGIGAQHASERIVNSVWNAMMAARPLLGRGRPYNDPEIIAKARADVAAGASISSVRRKYNLSGSTSQRLKAERNQ